MKAVQQKIKEMEEYKRNYIERKKKHISNLDSIYYATEEEK